MTRSAIYFFRSARDQATDAQCADLEAFAAAVGKQAELYTDDDKRQDGLRPAYGRLLQDVRAGGISRLTVWRLDKLWLEIGGLAELLGELAKLGVRFTSLQDDVDLEPSQLVEVEGLLNAVARAQRVFKGKAIADGLARAKAEGKRWWPTRTGCLQYLQPETVALVVALRDKGCSVAAIAEATGVTRPTVYRLLRQQNPKGRRRK